MTKYIVLLASLSLILLSSCASSKDVLYTFDTEKMGSENMKIQIQELENHKNYSLIRELIYRRGSYAGAIMFSVCSSSIIAKNRGFSHFVMLGNEDYDGCSDCEMSNDVTVGFLERVPLHLAPNIHESEETEEEKEIRLEKVRTYLQDNFPESIIINKDANIMSVEDYWLICKNVRQICSW